WSQIWSWSGPNRIRCFLWLAIQEKLLTNCSRVRRKMTSDASCDFCQHSEESVAHVLRDCTFAAESWVKLGSFDTSSGQWRGDFTTWLRRNIKSDNGTLFGTHCWMLWKARNERIFSDSRASTAAIAIRSANWARQIKVALERDNVAFGDGDGSADRRIGRATAGGILRDSEGRGLLAFSMNLGRCSITRAEMRGAIEGLRRTWDAGHRNVILRMDSRAAIALLTNASETPHQHAMEAFEFQDLQRRDWRLEIEHTFREGNRTADFLASLGYDYPFGSHNVAISDSRLGYFLRLDCFGIAVPRLISIND
ncbi:Putative ribonuclease H protein At1g65750, partial [Linum perenne]